MKQFFINLYNRLFRENKSFIVWSANAPYKPWFQLVGHFTYTIKFYPYRQNKYELTFEPYILKDYPSKMKAIEHEKYQHALKKLQEFQREELIEMIQLPTMEGISK